MSFLTLEHFIFIYHWYYLNFSHKHLLSFNFNSAIFRIESASNGTKYECDLSATDGALLCSHLHIELVSELEEQGTKHFLSGIVAVAQGLKDEWTVMSSVLTVTEKFAAH